MRTRALVLGGTGHVGSAVLHALAEAGIPTAFSYFRSTEQASALADRHGQHAYPLDLGNSAGIDGFLQSVYRETGVPDVLISCATHAHAGGLSDIDDDTWNRVMNVNVRGVFQVCRALVPHWRDGGDIVLVAGPDALGAAPSAPHFAASQAALAGFTRATAAELGPRGVRVNLLAVGVLDGGAGTLLSAERRRDAERYSALRRIGTAAEAARAIVWLATENPYLNGAIVPVTGGM